MKDTSYATEKIDAAGLLRYNKKLPTVAEPKCWLFRGAPRGYPLETSLERLLKDAGVNLSEAPDYERQLLKDFKRRAHHYLQVLPSVGDLMGWLALMQHYGAPTRLLDWTYSFYIAAYFALADATSEPDAKGNPPPPCVVWALNRNAFRLSAQTKRASVAYDRAERMGSARDDVVCPDSDRLQNGINAFLWSVMKKPEKCVWAVNPFRLNERLSVQQGVFLCPGDVSSTFEENLEEGKPTPTTVLRFELSTRREDRREMITLLYRMNINHASLFPGLQGFASSLRQKVWVPGILRPSSPTHK